ncbi:MAG: bestrophin family ion channel [Myxococcota bacterium]
MHDIRFHCGLVWRRPGASSRSRQYATANRWFVNIFIFLLPLALLGVFNQNDLPEVWAWTTVPVAVLLSWVFYFWDLVQEYSENPFEGLINDIPMDALSRTIERDLRDMLQETELPPGLAPIDGRVLM